MNVVKKLFYFITGGRPMRYIEHMFVDRVSGESIRKYVDCYGREWMSTNAWSMFRIRMPVTHVEEPVGPSEPQVTVLQNFATGTACQSAVSGPHVQNVTDQCRSEKEARISPGFS